MITCHSLQRPLFLFVKTIRSRILILQMWRKKTPTPNWMWR